MLTVGRSRSWLSLLLSCALCLAPFAEVHSQDKPPAKPLFPAAIVGGACKRGLLNLYPGSGAGSYPASVLVQAHSHLNHATSDPLVSRALIGAHQDRDAGVRREGVLALVKFGPAACDAAPALEELCRRDPDSVARSYAVRTLAKLQGEK